MFPPSSVLLRPYLPYGVAEAAIAVVPDEVLPWADDTTKTLRASADLEELAGGAHDGARGMLEGSEPEERGDAEAVISASPAICMAGIYFIFIFIFNFLYFLFSYSVCLTVEM